MDEPVCETTQTLLKPSQKRLVKLKGASTMPTLSLSPITFKHAV
ncbi:hypothetical protein SAMN04490179_4369 [Pseudomonas antarctica]|uniref:Uncharacterized protein n=1 Tax=Pseudomonas antarctica TaxID=219572 RepID=A0A1H0BMA2_9PSED|nr:hypothetical protein PSAN_47090 [Pseudomonas antarctica]SDN46593.1 hypothetical protein SAMN04490179_4369 [Pseudomonas antarctica]